MCLFLIACEWMCVYIYMYTHSPCDRFSYFCVLSGLSSSLSPVTAASYLSTDSSVAEPDIPKEIYSHFYSLLVYFSRIECLLIARD